MITSDLKLGIISCIKSFGFAVKHNLWVYFVPSLALTLITYFLLAASSGTLEGLSDWIKEAWLIGAFLQWLIDGINTTVSFLLIEFNKFLVLTLLSPVIALLSEKTEKIVTGNIYPFEIGQLIKDIARGVLIVLRNIVLELLLILCWYMLALITGFDSISPIVIMAIGFYFFGFSFIDYTNERRRLSVKQSAKFIRKHIGLTFVIGGVFSLLLMIPFLGLVIAAPIAVIAGTLAVHQLADLNSNKFAVHK
jgi:CysZ protein